MRIVYNKITKVIVSVIRDNTVSTTAYSNLEYGIIQGDDDDVEKAILALDLDVSQIPEIGVNETLKRVYRDRLTGQKLFNRFLSENKQISIPTAQNIQQLSMLINVKMMLDAGALETARDMLYMIPGTAFITTPGYASGAERKQSYIDEINTYINSMPK